MQGSETCWDLLGAARGGREAAQRALVERYAPALRAYFRGRGADSHQVEDLTQATWLQLFARVLEHADPTRGTFRGLLGTIAYRVWVSHRRSRHALKRGGRVDPAPIEGDVPDATDTEAFDREWFGRMLEVALGRLAHEHPTYFEAIDACLVRGTPHADFSASQGCSVQDVRNRLFRGRKKLHAYLAEQVESYTHGPAQHDTEIEVLGRYLGW